MQDRKRTVRGGRLAAAGLIIATSAVLANAAEAQPTLKIGVLGVMSGPSASWGLVSKYSAEAEIAAMLCNEKGGVEIGGLCEGEFHGIDHLLARQFVEYLLAAAHRPRETIEELAIQGELVEERRHGRHCRTARAQIMTARTGQRCERHGDASLSILSPRPRAAGCTRLHRDGRGSGAMVAAQITPCGAQNRQRVDAWMLAEVAIL